MRLLDLFCGAGGCSMGYHNAGFEVTGMDIKPQPHYPFDFIRGDAVDDWMGEWISRQAFDAVHASPPCQHHSLTQRIRDRDHTNFIAEVRELLEITGLPYVIENVKGAPLRNPQLLEGQMFGLATHRPRIFETNWGYEAPLLRPPPPRQAKMGRPLGPGEAIQVVGNFSDVTAAREAMGISWMMRDELRDAIPPAYTEHVGGYLMAHLNAEVAA